MCVTALLTFKAFRANLRWLLERAPTLVGPEIVRGVRYLRVIVLMGTRDCPVSSSLVQMIVMETEFVSMGPLHSAAVLHSFLVLTVRMPAVLTRFVSTTEHVTRQADSPRVLVQTIGQGQHVKLRLKLYLPGTILRLPYQMERLQAS
jgi:hypothetical protein